MPASPTDVAGLTLWLEADATGSVLSNTDPIATWNDQSAANVDGSATVGNRPLYLTGQVNGLPVADFDGVDDQVVSAASTSLSTQTWIAVLKPDAFTNYGSIVASDGGDAALQLRTVQTTGVVQALSQATAALGSSSTALSTSSYQCVTFSYNTGTGAYAFFLNGTADGSGTNAQSFTAGRTVSMGFRSGEVFDGKIALLLQYNSVLSAGNRAIPHTYVQNKYGITMSDYVSGSTTITYQYAVNIG